MLRKKWLTISGLASALVLVFFGPANAAVEKGPYLIYDGVSTEMTVLWQLSNSQSCTIKWGEDTSYLKGTDTTSEYGSDHQHKYTITDLSPGTKYFYQVICSPDDVGSGSFYIAPLENADSAKLMVYGDTRTFPADHDAVNAQMITTYSNDSGYQTLTLHVGDWVGNGDSEDDWAYQFFDPDYLNTHEFQANMPINGCKGNHEGSGDLFFKYFPYLYEPGGFYWSFDYGPVHIVVIDQYVDYSPGSEQYNWLVNDLASSNKVWKFLVFHEPGWSANGVHGNNVDVQDYIQPLCLTYGVDIVFAGHNHYYARCDVSAVQHITTGGGGAPLHTPDPNFPYVVAAASLFHFCEVNIQKHQLYFTARDHDGYVIDEFSIVHLLDELAVDFGTYGLWIYDGSSWASLAGSDPFGMEEWSGGLAVDFETYGLWNYDESTWTSIAGWNPEGMETWVSGLAVDFGTYGLWNYDGSAWTSLAGWDPSNIKTYGSGLAVDFDTHGLWNYDGSAWTSLAGWDPSNIKTYGSGLAVDFDTHGLWYYDGTAWKNLAGWDPEDMEAWSTGLAVDFGSYGLWNYVESSWTSLAGWDPDVIEAYGNGLAVDFETYGLWHYDGSAWTSLAGWNAEDMEAWGTGLAVDFGSYGLWNYDGSSWTSLAGWGPEDMIDVDLY